MNKLLTGQNTHKWQPLYENWHSVIAFSFKMAGYGSS